MENIALLAFNLIWLHTTTKFKISMVFIVQIASHYFPFPLPGQGWLQEARISWPYHLAFVSYAPAEMDDK